MQSSRNSADDTYQAWHRLGTSDATLSVIDIARDLAARARDRSPLVRALAAEDVYLSLSAEGTVATSQADGRAYVHVFSSPTRLTASVPRGESTMSMSAAPLAAFARQWPPGTGVRLDPDTAVETVLEPEDVRHVAATAAGIPTPAALTAVEGEELRLARGPEAATDLDQRVVGVGFARLVRFTATLDGAGGRLWPVYVGESDLPPNEAAARIDDAAGVPVVAVVNGEPAWVLDVLRAGLDDAVTLR
ncbi:SseB family protein [Georgenia faecalis]|uniref:SseB family protein n=1 Tax=Georgenia faecalis TaxID=2483799 RepID=A0ABV9DBX4_9MICO|nr:SseB family protein [Georgenia faecalis]